MPFFHLIEAILKLCHLSEFLIRKNTKPTTNRSCTYCEESIKILLQHYGGELPAESIVGVEFAVPLFISSDLQTE